MLGFEANDREVLMRRVLIQLIVMCAVLMPGLARAGAASDPVETGNAVSQLVAERAGIAPGETIRVGLYQDLREGWHVYWMNPGDSGLPLVLDWTLPDGFAAGEIGYPLPHRIPLGPLVNFGHEGTPLFTVPITAPDSAIPGEPVSFSVEADWLICADICIPESATLDIVIPVVDAPAGPDPTGGPIFEAAAGDMPSGRAIEAVWFEGEDGPVIEISGGVPEAATELFFFPAEQSLVEPAADQIRQDTEDGVRLYMTSSYQYAPAEMETLDGVIAWQADGYEGVTIAANKIDTPAGAGVPPTAAAPGAAADADSGSPSPGAIPADPVAAGQGLLAILFFALIGGVILNIMPCVFPVIFIKAANLAQSVQEDRAAVIRHGLLYTAGILAAFAAIAGLLLVLRAGGEQLGWGFHLQSPVTVGVFAIVIFLVGLNLAGVFEIGTSVQGVGSGLASRGGNAGAFFTGLLAVAVAAPCIGPFLGVPVGFALSAQQSPFVGLLVFLVMGIGLALPYLLISLMPGLARVMPKPGAWMQTAKQLLSFAMFATLIWLVWTLTLQAGPDGLVMLLIALLIVGFAAWAFGRGQGAGGTRGRLVARGAAALALIAGIVVVAGIEPAPRGPVTASMPGEGDTSQLPTVMYSEDRLAELREAGTPVFVDFTAAWCVTCQVNKQTVLTRAQVVEAFHEKGVVYMLADWTVQDPEITAALEAQGRSGVPLYLFYAPGAEEPDVLPQVLSTGLMRETFAVL